MTQGYDNNWTEQIARTQVVILAGGRARRMGIDIPKCMLDICDKKLIDICVEELAADGFRDFIFLLGHKHEMVTEHLLDITKNLRINIKVSIDPPTIAGWGKGKAFKYSLANAKIDRSRRSMIVFPDDIVLEEKVYSKFLRNHTQAASKCGIFASTLLVPATEYPYAVAEVDNNGIVTKFEEKPFLNIPTSVGVYLFEPDVYEIIDNNINLMDESPVDLESTVMPKLVNMHKLSSMFISSDKWMPINTMKEFEKALKVLSPRVKR